jgi:phospholipase/carboxylesterase
MALTFTTSQFEFEWIPASRAVSRSSQRVMVVLHGHGDSLKAFRSIKSELRLPHMNYLLLNAPRKYAGGFTWGRLEPRTQKDMTPVRTKLFELVEELEQAGWRSEQIFWLGHSQGCLVACDLVLNHPKAFGGLIGVSGYVWFFRGWKNRARSSGARRTPWLITHGTRDRIIVPDEIREDVAKLTGVVPVLYREFLKGHDFDYQSEVPFIRSWLAKSQSERQQLAFLPYDFLLQ